MQHERIKHTIMLFCYVGKKLSMRNIKADTSGCWIERERERESV